ncbi:hypothetical protein [Flavobacterium sp. N2820]|uniref:hypothetical protein n=1 Tax=Flavobacterium sp. N2820 TaxID=2986834 RepID=UPI0022249CB9|nr:hypothetical protein [Flavobacterium sp. N2820]
MKTKILILSLLATTIISCNTIKSGTAKTIDIYGAGVLHKPVIADLEVNPQKTSKTIKLKSIESLENAKNEIVRELLKENNADLLIEPKFESTTINGKTELTVNGWLAFYKNFRPIKEEDIKFLEIKTTINNKVEKTQPVILQKKK